MQARKRGRFELSGEWISAAQGLDYNLGTNQLGWRGAWLSWEAGGVVEVLKLIMGK